MTTQPAPAPTHPAGCNCACHLTSTPKPGHICLSEMVGEAEAERLLANAADIDRLTCDLVDHVGTANLHVLKAQQAIARLMSNEVYDTEFAESDDGRDVVAELATVARALRNVERMAMQRRENLLEDERAAKDFNAAAPGEDPDAWAFEA